MLLRLCSFEIRIFDSRLAVAAAAAAAAAAAGAAARITLGLEFYTTNSEFDTGPQVREPREGEREKRDFFPLPPPILSQLFAEIISGEHFCREDAKSRIKPVIKMFAASKENRWKSGVER